MADELIDILNKQGTPTGEVKLKSEAHRLGLYHASVHIWLYTTEGNLLFQQRAKNKDTYPNLWDVSVAGHIAAGEVPVHSALREIEEEIGLSIKKEDLEVIGIHLAEKEPSPKLFDNEFHHIFISELKVPLEHLILQLEEVAAIKLIHIHDFRKQLNTDILSRKYVPHGSEYFDRIIESIEKKLRF